jgi:DNA segregation ATPase FtsK/SpoIIIE, S-DNA-T family
MLAAAACPSLADVVQGELLPNLLSVSTVNVLSYGPDSRVTAIVPPWHPLRLLATIAKAKQFGVMVDKICSAEYALSDADGDLLFEDLREWLFHAYYPEVICRLQGAQPKLLAISDHHADYSVYGPPVRDPGAVSSDDSDPKAAAKHIANIVAFYLSLQPHERDNLSVVLFDCDSEILPEAVVDEIRSMNEDEEQDAMCQILLTHSDKGKLRALYRTLCRRDEGPDSFNSSEATRDFMARLRINIMVAENGNEMSKGGQPYDIVFADNTVARRARLKWEEMDVDVEDASVVKPSMWSRRRPMRSGSVTSAVYLTSPRAPACVWKYLDAISHACEPDQARGTTTMK